MAPRLILIFSLQSFLILGAVKATSRKSTALDTTDGKKDTFSSSRNDADLQSTDFLSHYPSEGQWDQYDMASLDYYPSTSSNWVEQCKNDRFWSESDYMYHTEGYHYASSAQQNDESMFPERSASLQDLADESTNQETIDETTVDDTDLGLCHLNQEASLSSSGEEADPINKKGILSAEVRRLRRLESSKRAKEKRKEMRTEYWQSLRSQRGAKKALMARYISLLDHPMHPSKAIARLQIHCDAETAANLYSDEPERQIKALHKIGFNLGEPLLNNSERARLLEIIKSLYGVGDNCARTAYYQGRKVLNKTDADNLRSLVYKSDEVLIRLAGIFYQEYLNRYAKWSREKKLRDKENKKAGLSQ